jgi:hypothetical protein
MARGDGEWWLRGLPVRRKTSNPPAYDRVIDVLQAGVSAWLFVGLIDDRRWLSALGALVAIAFVGAAASVLSESVRGKGPLKGESRVPAPWISLVAAPLAGAAIYFVGTFASQTSLQIAGIAILALLALALKLRDSESAS